MLYSMLSGPAGQFKNLSSIGPHSEVSWLQPVAAILLHRVYYACTAVAITHASHCSSLSVSCRCMRQGKC